MANIRFHLKRSSDSTKETAIFFLLHASGKQIKVYPGISIQPKYWNDKKRRAVEWETFPKGKKINQQIDEIEAKAKKALLSLENNFKPITSENFKKALSDQEKTVRGAKNENLQQFISDLIEKTRNGQRLTAKGTRFSYNTVKNYETLLKHLQKFEQESSYKVNFSTVNMEFYRKYLDFCNQDNKALNTTGRYIKILKAISREARKQGLKIHPEALSSDFKNIGENTDMVYLSETELNKIYQLDLSNNPILEGVKNTFVLGCYTGLRFGDLTSLQDSSFFNNGQFAKIKTQKTGETVTIPLHWTVKEILQKYNYQMPKMGTNQKTNIMIREVCRMAGIDNRVTVFKTIGGRSTARTLPKYSLITTHTARRSFASNLFLAGVPSISIMKITGHKTERAFLTYIRISGEDNAAKLMEHPFFQQKPILDNNNK